MNSFFTSKLSTFTLFSKKNPLAENVFNYEAKFLWSDIAFFFSPLISAGLKCNIAS